MTSQLFTSNMCSSYLYALPVDKRPNVDRDTFITLAQIASCNVLMSTHDGFYRQIDGLAMGSPPAPHLANGWLRQYDHTIRGESKLYFRYMDDIVKENKRHQCEEKLQEMFKDYKSDVCRMKTKLKLLIHLYE